MTTQNTCLAACRRGHDMRNPDNVVVKTDGRRQCRTCQRMHQQRWRQRHPGIRSGITRRPPKILDPRKHQAESSRAVLDILDLIDLRERVSTSAERAEIDQRILDLRRKVTT